MTPAPGANQGKHVILHVGLPKTGTTAFQDGVDLNQDLIAPTISFGRKRDMGTAGEAFREEIRKIVQKGPNLMRRARLKKAARALRAWVDSQPTNTVLISDENLLGFRVRDMYRTRYADGPGIAVEALRGALNGCTLSWVLVGRDAEAHMRSSYRYFVKLRGVSAPYEDWAKSIGTAEALERLVADAAADFGDRGHILDMDVERKKPGPWGGRILSIAGLPDTTLARMKPAPVTNKGLPDDLLPYIRKINDIGLSKADRLKAIDVMLTLHSDLSGVDARDVYGKVGNRA